MSKVRDCTYCHQRISIRQMPFGQWVAFDVPANTPHECHQPAPVVAAKTAPAIPVLDRGSWRDARRKAVLAALRGLPFASVDAGRLALPIPSTQRIALTLADDVVGRLGLLDTLEATAPLAIPDSGSAQGLLDDARPGEEIGLTTGLAIGPLIIDDTLTISGEDRDGVHLWSGNGPAVVIDAASGTVTLRQMTLNADSPWGTILVRSGSLRLEDCVVAGRIGIVVAAGVGPVELSNARIVCPEGGCGIVAGRGTSVIVQQIWIGAHKGIGILGLAGSEIESNGFRFVGDDGIGIHRLDA